ncbi:thioredoxin family protein [Maritimibacter sp. DP1N21-5]|uniref:SoxW family protein n=1 Tax=Maritimibacter sp. DP1N21-5 TaxID=2836867 RepID=UPI001C490F64|nr:thioredoxin family protein [Maritimibacter sp. DP1N21-5]MBV7409590.1 thioredoxin family protein [Maritimibacter sp. DP1N21-5]
MRFLTALATAATLAFPAFAATMGDDGLHKEVWMRDTFKDVAEDLAEAEAEGKRLMILWEQRGCIYCTKMHEEVFPREDLAQYIEDNFFVVQMNLFGDVEVTDLDGETLSEKDMAMKWGVMFTPTMMFLPHPEEIEEGETARDAAQRVAIMPGAFGYHTTKNLMTFVFDEAYRGDENFQKYHAAKFAEWQAANPGQTGE